MIQTIRYIVKEQARTRVVRERRSETKRYCGLVKGRATKIRTEWVSGHLRCGSERSGREGRRKDAVKEAGKKERIYDYGRLCIQFG